MMCSIEGGDLQGIIGVMIPVVAIVGGLSLGFAGFYLRYRERMEMISRGMDISALNNIPRRRRNPLRSGLVVLGAGLGLLSAYVLCNTVIVDKYPGENHSVIYFGFVATFIGLGLILSYMLEKKGPTDANNQ
jgi:uncharacterized protein DUF6249